MYITLDEAKKQLNIEVEYIEDDLYIADLIDVVETVVELHINQNLEDLKVSNNNVLPKNLKHAMLMLLAHYYNVREAVSFTAKSVEIPLSYKYLLDFHQNYLKV